MSKRTVAHSLLLCALVSVVGLIGWASLVRGDGPLYTMEERFGIGLSPNVGRPITDYDLSSLRVGWYSDWGLSLSPAQPGGIEYVQLVNVKAGNLTATPANIGAIAAQNPGALWIIGNEPENKWQGNCSPAQYAAGFKQAYDIIMGADPTARIAIGGVTEPTPLRLEWLEQVLASYTAQFGVDMKSHIDVWTIHVQIVPERRGWYGGEIPVGLLDDEGEIFGFTDSNFAPNADVTILKQLVNDFCEWMVDQGERDKELIISEYGVLFPSDMLDSQNPAHGDQMVIDFMTSSFDYFLSAKDARLGNPTDGGRLVQRWLWYSLNEKPYDVDPAHGFNGSLFEWDDPGQLTIFGEAYRDYAYMPFKVYLSVVSKP